MISFFDVVSGRKLGESTPPSALATARRLSREHGRAIYWSGPDGGWIMYSGGRCVRA